MRFISLCLVCLFGFSGTALAQKLHVEKYRAYNEALERGDVAAAETYAKDAWRAAETALGDNQTTAVLAYNYANMIYAVKPAEAIEPLARVIAIAGEGSGLFGADEPIVMLRYAEAMAAPNARNKKILLADTLAARAGAGAPLSFLAGRAWQHLALAEMSRKRYENAGEYAAKAVRHFRATDTGEKRELINALISAGVVRVGGRARSNTDIVEAAEYFNEAIELFPIQNGIDDFDSTLALALAWYATAESALDSDYGDAKKSGGPTRLKDRKPILPAESKVRITGAPGPFCSFEWNNRKPPRFPTSDALRGYLGAVVVGYHLDQNGAAIGSTILAEVPGRSQFGERTLAAVEKWEAQGPISSACQRNHLTIFRFYIDQ